MSNEQDLTPAEARAEIEAFMGDGWKFGAHASNTGYYAYAHRPDFAVRVDGLGPTFRAAVSALKQAWRDAVRPWVSKAAYDAWGAGCGAAGGIHRTIEAARGLPVHEQHANEARIIATRVLKESDHD